MPHLEAAIWNIASASSLSSLCCAAACFSSAVPLQRRCSHCEMPVSLLFFFYPSNAAIGRPSSRACANSMQTHHNTRITAGHWHFDANVPCGRASAFSFAMLVLRCPASEKAALLSLPDNALLACCEYYHGALDLALWTCRLSGEFQLYNFPCLTMCVRKPSSSTYS